MAHTTRIKIAALATALFIGGLTAAGVGLRSTPANETASAQPTQPQPGAAAAPSQVQPAAARADDGETYEDESEDGEREDGGGYGREIEDD